MSYPSEKNPEALASLLGATHSAAGVPGERPPPYVPTFSQPTSDEKIPVSLSSTSPLTSPSTTSLASIDDVSRPKTSTCSKFFISQQGNTLRPWPWCYSNELVTPIYDSTRTTPLFTSTKFKKNSGTCVMTPVYSAENPEPVDPRDRLEVHTTYFFGPGNDPVISVDFGGEDRKVEIMVKSKGKLTRSRWFEWNGDRYEWRYIGKKNGDGMVLQRVITPVQGIPVTTGTDEKRPVTSMCCNGKGKAKKCEEDFVTVAEFMRAEEENKRCMGFSPAGQGGWVTIYGKQGEGEGKRGLPEWLLLASCLVMLKRERDRRTIQIHMMMSGGAGGGP